MPDKPVPKKPVSRPIGIDVKTNPRDLDRSRAEFAWNSVSSVKKNQPDNHQKKYGSLARKMPTLIQVNGLAQTLAFLKAKGKGTDHHIQIFKHLSDWVCHRLNLGSGDLLSNYVLKMDSQRYRLTTSEALAFLQWLKRFAEAELGSEEDA
ncbi:MAG: type III-B CRISPR module-associated protein Cmr5 [Coleofasciculus sp. Co-bin14]|nr:type III-B CRISPR module-associated protein Cmr5 [Coleofasciculus sp. Co-bin14]